MKHGLNSKFIVGFVMVLLLLVNVFSIQVKAQGNHEMQPIAIQGALNEEIEVFLKKMGDYQEEKHGNYSFYLGKIDDIPVVINRTEMGMVNAATSTTLLAEKYHPKAIINQGTAGAHDPVLQIFDTVIGTKVVNIGSFRSDYLAKGEGMAPKTWKHMPTTIRQANGETREVIAFESDPELVRAALSVADKYKHGKVLEGTIGSADFWNREVDRILWFHENFGTSTEDMETFAVAQVSNSYNIPFLSLRTISNSDILNSERKEQRKAGQYCAQFTIEVVKAIGKS